jgi:dTDP-4-amino-4,6-dideoxygalactose transaminase
VRRRWERACEAAGVPLVVDSAAGFGAVAADGVPIGAQGDVEVVSFHALKPLSSGEGGAVFCRDEAVAARVTRLINFSFDEHHEAMELLALNAKLSEPAAAIALASLDDLPDALAARRQHAEAITNALADDVRLQDGAHLGTWQFVPVALPDSVTRSAILVESARRGVTLRTYYDPLHVMRAFAECERADDLGVTEDLGRRLLSLPMAVDLDDDDLARIVNLVLAGHGSALST